MCYYCQGGERSQERFEQAGTRHATWGGGGHARGARGLSASTLVIRTLTRVITVGVERGWESLRALLGGGRIWSYQWLFRRRLRHYLPAGCGGKWLIDDG